MKKLSLQINFLGLLLLAFITSCNGQVKTRLSNQSTESATTPVGKPKLVKTQGSKDADNICCSMQDKAGNLWFGTTGEGVYRYDGQSFIQYTVKDGLSSNGVYSHP